MNKKGFTLIELLAVIVILAVIALIATPAVLNIIEDSKRSAAEDSARVISKAAETYYMSETTLEGGKVTGINLTDDTLKYKGEQPSKGYVTFDEKGNSYLKMYMNGYCIESNYDNTVTSEKVDSSDCKIDGLEPFEDGEVVYFNPISNSVCDNYDATTNSQTAYTGATGTGCMKWYAFLDEEGAETVKLILDHNTEDMVAWNSDSTATTPVTVNLKLQSDVSGWDPQYRITLDTNGYITSGNSRLISVTEIDAIADKYALTAEGYGTANQTWNVNNSTTWYDIRTGLHNWSGGETNAPHPLGWLIDNLNNCAKYGCYTAQSSRASAYWTSDHVLENGSSAAWALIFTGRLTTSTVNINGSYGIRPVIEVPRSKLSGEEPTYTVTFKDGNSKLTTKELAFGDSYGEFPALSTEGKEGYILEWLVNDTVVTSDSLVKVFGDHEVVAHWKFGKELYFNPIINEVCTIADYNATTNSVTGFKGTTDNGCLKWNTVNEENGNYLLQLDHNASERMTWESMATEIANVKNNNKYGWHADVRSTVRMISAEEINAIAPRLDSTPWDVTDESTDYALHTGTDVTNLYLTKGTNKYAWLFDNLYYCQSSGCNVQSTDTLLQGYWTSDKVGSNKAWYVSDDGRLEAKGTSSLTNGLRPVISVSKTKFANAN